VRRLAGRGPPLQHFQRMNKFRQSPLLQGSAVVGANGRQHALLLRRNRSLDASKRGRYDAIAPICDGTSSRTPPRPVGPCRC
jgi:hypothetical protein